MKNHDFLADDLREPYGQCFFAGECLASTDDS
jgi:hypothetical protein